MSLGDGAVGVRYAGKYLGDGEALTNYTCGHDNSSAWGELGFEAGVDGTSHARGIFEAPFACDGISAAGVDDDGSDAFAATILEDLAADDNRSGLKPVLREHCGARAGGFGGNKCKVRKAGIAWLDTDVRTGNKETSGVGPGRGNVFLFCSWYCSVNWCRIASVLYDKTSLGFLSLVGPEHRSCKGML